MVCLFGMAVGILDEFWKIQFSAEMPVSDPPTPRQLTGLCPDLSPGPQFHCLILHVENTSAFLFECQFLTSAIS